MKMTWGSWENAGLLVGNNLGSIKRAGLQQIKLRCGRDIVTGLVDPSIYKECKEMLDKFVGFACGIGDCTYNSATRWQELQRHLWVEHRKSSLCTICANANRKFVSELPRYNQKEIKQHKKVKEKADEEGLKGHPECRLCSSSKGSYRQFYDDRALWEHKNNIHPVCLICEPQRYFKSINDLNGHNHDQHHCCLQVDCMENGGAFVFSNEIKLIKHMQECHPTVDYSSNSPPLLKTTSSTRRDRDRGESKKRSVLGQGKARNKKGGDDDLFSGGRGTGLEPMNIDQQRACLKCLELVRSKVATCPHCGFEDDTIQLLEKKKASNTIATKNSIPAPSAHAPAGETKVNREKDRRKAQAKREAERFEAKFEVELEAKQRENMLLSDWSSGTELIGLDAAAAEQQCSSTIENMSILLAKVEKNISAESVKASENVRIQQERKETDTFETINALLNDLVDQDETFAKIEDLQVKRTNDIENSEIYFSLGMLMANGISIAGPDAERSIRLFEKADQFDHARGSEKMVMQVSCLMPEEDIVVFWDVYVASCNQQHLLSIFYVYVYPDENTC